MHFTIFGALPLATLASGWTIHVYKEAMCGQGIEDYSPHYRIERADEIATPYDLDMMFNLDSGAKPGQTCYYYGTWEELLATGSVPCAGQFDVGRSYQIFSGWNCLLAPGYNGTRAEDGETVTGGSCADAKAGEIRSVVCNYLDVSAFGAEES